MTSIFERRAESLNQKKNQDNSDPHTYFNPYTNQMDTIGSEPYRVPKQKEESIFEKRAKESESEESWGKWAFRTASQIPQGIAQAFTYPADLANLVATGESLEGIDDFQRAAERSGIPFDEESYRNATSQIQSSFPTQSNLARYVEEKTGLPLQPKTGLQKFVNFASTAGALSPKDYTFRGMNTSLPRPVLGTGVATANEALKLTGLPEPISEIASFAVLKQPAINPKALNSTMPTKKLYDKIKDTFSTSQQTELLESGIIPKGLSKSQFETAEELLNLIKNEKMDVKFIGETPQTATSGKIKPERIQPVGKDLGLRPVSQKVNPTLQEQVGNTLSPNKFYNTTQGGKALKNELIAIDDKVYKNVNKLYEKSRALNKNIQTIHPELVDSISSKLAELNLIPALSDIQKRLSTSYKKLLKNLAVFEEGQISGYLPINNQALIDQIQAFRQIVDFDFSHGNAKNIFKPIIADIQKSVLDSAKKSGNAMAEKALLEAKQSYKSWAENFDNPYVRPFRDKTNKDHSKLFKSSLDFDESNMIKNVLDLTPRGKELIKGATREIVEKNLSKYFDNPKLVETPEFKKTMRELEAVITPKQSEEIQKFFKDRSKLNIRAKLQVKKTTNDEKIASKFMNNKPEDIQKMMNSRSGIKELREIAKNGEKKVVFERLQKQKLRSLLREQNIEKNFVGDDLYKMLNKEKNYELFSEILGETETESLRQLAKDIGKKQVRLDKIKSSIKTTAKNIAGYKALKLIIDVL